MRMQINLEIELTPAEANFLRKYYVDDREKNLCVIFLYTPQGIRDLEQIKILTGLIEKEILIKDELENTRLSSIGQQVCDLIDRDLKLKKLLDE